MSAPRVIAAVLAGALAAAAGTAAFVQPWEGRELDAYRDVVGVWTICEGITGPDVVRGRKATPTECDALLETAVARHLTGIAACINVPLKQNEWVAVGSWAFNVGVYAACNSGLVRKINAGVPAVTWCRDLLKWDKGRKNGKLVAIRGLTNRRKAEFKTCIGVG
ncbi:lysozyme [Pseudoxanthomonas sp. CF125]|uniref:lysozyme n=1 Tax=Pseudoxanthomonas sp. CF125 TaxID=1855303 RepID=UPI000886141A|nr:lysozyme [Pseudoxanthomonas sp. CF125]SDQ42498.1 lysozyme [Pseudoxanthomonas sp. CF125]